MIYKKQKSNNNNISNKKVTYHNRTDIVYDDIPIKKIKKAKKGKHGHFHVIADEVDGKYISLGLTSDDPESKRNRKMHPVYESNNILGRMHRSAEINNKDVFDSNNANFKVDVDTANKAREKAARRKARYIEEKAKKK